MNTQSKIIKVLLMEDNPGDARLIQEMVSEVDGAAFGLERVDRLSTGLEHLSVKDVDVILLDLGLPDSVGLDTFKKVHAHVPEVPIVMLTGLDDAEIAIEGVRMGAQDYLVKGRVDGNLLSRILLYSIERKKTGKSLQESEIRFRELFNNMSSGVAVYKAKEGGKDFIFTDFNHAAEKLDDIKREDLLGRSVLEVFPGVRNFGLFDVFQRVWNTGKPERHPISFYKDERNVGWRENYVYKLPSGEIVAVYDDVTERKQAEEALRVSEAQKQALLDGSPDMIMQIDRNMKILWANQTAFDMNPDALGLTCHKAFADMEEPCENCPCKKALNTGQVEMGVQYQPAVVGIQGGSYWEDIGVPVKDSDGKVVGVIEIARNVTERKQAEKELAKYRDHLEELVKERTRDLEAAHEELIKHERLSVLGQLTATVSHDLRNPLGVIRSSSFYIQRKLGGAVDEKINKHLNRIEKQVDLCDTIVGDLLEYTRGRASEVIHGKITPLLEEILEETTTPEQVGLVSDFSPELPAVLFDRDKIRRVVINLIRNAFQAVTVRRDIWNDEEGLYQPLVKVTSSKAGNGIRIEVEDNGIGMDDETARRAFEPLFTKWARGTGLGLAIVKKIVDEHGGSVSLESIPDHGTKVIVIIPTEACATGSDSSPVVENTTLAVPRLSRNGDSNPANAGVCSQQVPKGTDRGARSP
ncbi:MAG: PAS domain-containing protein [Deltaproteobacteria bacterium]|nr:PAS domain-containing protein [Deltaproteobacteria bacterium]